MKKQGFTLIELMVVVVIIGILAAVAVPKLFGMIAKSKASEVGPAAGTYVKLQDAYVSESNAIGSWKLIGYVAPGAQTSGTAGTTTNFKYEMGSVAADASVLLTGTLGQVWKATNVPALNDCTANNCVWELHVKAGSTGDGVEYGTKVPANGAPLTPTFAKIGTYDAQ